MLDNSNHHDTVNGFHLFEIKRYSAIKDVGPGRYISSNTFNVGGYTWALYFYPDGKYMEDNYNSKYVSVFVVLSSYGKDVEASFELTLLDQSEKGIHKGCSTPSTTLNSRGINMWGSSKFMRRSNLESSCFLKDDSLSFCCKVKVARSCIAEAKTFTTVPAQSEMEKDIKYLLDTETGCDIVFRVKGDRFKAHKLILAARSPVFRAQFYGLVANPDLAEVDLKEIEPSVFKAMLSFIYSNKLPDFEEIMDPMTMSTSRNFILHLLAAADRFGLDPLMKLCEAKLCEELNVDMWGTTLLLAHDHHCSQLKAFCLKFAKANLRVVIETEGYKHIQDACPSLLADLLQEIALES